MPPKASACLLAVTALSLVCNPHGTLPPANGQDLPPGAEFRTWTDASGRFQTEAAMIDVADGKVRLRKRDGKTVAVPIRRLAAADQGYVRRRLARRRAAAKASSRPPATSNPSAAEWPGWRGPHRDGKSPDTGLLKSWPPQGPPLVWHVDGIGKGFSTVAVDQGVVYTSGDVGDRLTIFAFDLDGKPKWKTPHDAAWTSNHPGSRSTPMIDHGNLYIVSGHGLVGCYDAASGRPKWTAHLKQFGGKVPGWGYAESVLILGDLAIVTPGGKHCIVALDKNNGRPLWTSQGFEAGAQYGSCYACQHQGLPMIVTGTSEGIVAVDPRNGRMLWANPFSAKNTANCPTPVYSDGFVFWANGYGKGGICLKLDARAGHLNADTAWTTRDMVCHHGGYVIHQGYIYGNNGSGWACLELKTGKTLWRERAVGKGSLCFADGMLYLFGENGGKVALATCSPQGLQVRGSFSVAGDGPSWAHPVVIGGRLYLRYDDNLYCYNVRASTTDRR